MLPSLLEPPNFVFRDGSERYLPGVPGDLACVRLRPGLLLALLVLMRDASDRLRTYGSGWPSAGTVRSRMHDVQLPTLDLVLEYETHGP